MIAKIIAAFNDGFLYGVGYIVGRALGFCYQHPMLILACVICLVVIGVNKGRAIVARK